MSESAPGPGRRSPARRRPAAAALAAVLALVVAAALLLTRLAGDDRDQPGTGPAAPVPTTAAVDLAGLSIDRTAFCDRLPAADIGGALAAPVTGRTRYRSGERTLLAPGVQDVTHEFGCTYTAATGAQARVWVFAAPVPRPVAARISRDARRGRGCRALAGGPAFGTASARTVCAAPTPYGTVVTLRGLFGDAWLSCQVSTAGTEPQADVVRRGERWCVRVATTLGHRS